MVNLKLILWEKKEFSTFHLILNEHTVRITAGWGNDFDVL